MNEPDSESASSLIPYGSRELAAPETAQNRIVSEMIESSLVLARASAVSTIDLDSLVREGKTILCSLVSGFIRTPKIQANTTARIQASDPDAFGLFDWGEEKPAAAFSLFSRAADAGNREAQCLIPICIFCGAGDASNSKQACATLQALAVSGLPQAQYFLGYLYLELSKLLDVASQLCEELHREPTDEELAAKIGVSAVAISHQRNALNDPHSFGIEFEPSHDFGKAGFRWYHKAGEQGVLMAQLQLGQEYYFGYTLPQDYVQAVGWYFKAAKQGDADGQRLLALCYCRAHGVSQDYVEAAKWYRKAADQGSAGAQYELGKFYYEGKGVQQNYREAVKWLLKAADQDERQAPFALGYHYAHGYGVPQDYEEAARWYQKAAEKRDDGGQNALGNCYYRGEGVRQDYAEAVKWYRKAAEQGNATAQTNLAFCYRDGKGVPQDYAEAAKWFRQAADQGNAEAQNSLGTRYFAGQGVPEDKTEAVRWYRKAALQGRAESQWALGHCFSRGHGVETDLPQAHAWYQLAAEQGDNRAAKEATALAALMSPREFETARALHQQLRDKHAAHQ